MTVDIPADNRSTRADMHLVVCRPTNARRAISQSLWDIGLLLV